MLEIILTFLGVFMLIEVAVFIRGADHPIDKHRESVRSQRRIG